MPPRPSDPDNAFARRFAEVRASMARARVDVALVSVGADLPWLTGYEAMPLERLTMLVLPVDRQATLVVPALEAPRVVERPDVFDVLAWSETQDPVDLVGGLCGSARSAAIGDQTWARFLVDLQQALPSVAFSKASELIGPLRAVKDPDEIERLAVAAAAADRAMARVQNGDIALVGRSEAAIAADLGRALLDEGHEKVNFTIVASGPNGASPHHEPSARRVEPGDVVLFDIGGTMRSSPGEPGYCSDISRCVSVGPAPQEVRDAYAALVASNAAGVGAAQTGAPCQDVDRAARSEIDEAGFGPWFVHRTGHGIGVEAHEDPYIVEGNLTPLVAGHAFSVEPGIYVPGQFGIRLEDIVVATDDGPRVLNEADRSLVELDA